PGDSGGPLVNDRAALVGVAHSIRLDAQNLSAFIDLSECKLLIEKYFKSIGEKWVPEPEPAGEEAVALLPDLIRKLGHKDCAVRLQAAQTLREMGPEASLAFGTLFQMLKDSEAVVRRAAADALSRVPPHKDDLSMLCQVCKEGAEPVEVRLQAVQCLAKLGADAKPALGILAALAKQKDDRLQHRALEAMAAIGLGSPEIVAITPLLRTGNIEVRRLVLAALTKAGRDARTAVPELVELLKVDDRELQLNTLKVLDSIGPDAKDAVAPLTEMLKARDKDIAVGAGQ